MSRVTDTAEEIKATVASVGRRVWLANFAMRAMKVIEYVLTMAYFAALLYSGTWIVVLALRHSGAIR